MFFRCENETKFKAEDVHWAYSFCPTPYSWTALVGLVLYLVFFAPGKHGFVTFALPCPLLEESGYTVFHSLGDFYCSFHCLLLRNGTNALDREL